MFTQDNFNICYVEDWKHKKRKKKSLIIIKLLLLSLNINVEDKMDTVFALVKCIVMLYRPESSSSIPSSSLKSDRSSRSSSSSSSDAGLLFLPEGERIRKHHAAATLCGVTSFRCS